MNDFSKEELKELLYGLYCRAKNDGSMVNKELYEKVQFMINNYWLPENVNIIGTGQILFDNVFSSNGVMAKINEQLCLCQNEDEQKMYRIDWKILFGHKHGSKA